MISTAADSGRKSLTPGMARTFRGSLSAEGCGFWTAEMAANATSANEPIITTSAMPTPRFPQARQNRFGVASQSRKAFPRWVWTVVMGPWTRTESGSSPRALRVIATRV
jgi:hypothetical protein